MAKYSAVTLGTVEAIINKLGGLEGIKKFLRNELVMDAEPLPEPESKVSVPLRVSESLPLKESSPLPVSGPLTALMKRFWKKIVIGTGLKTINELRNAMKKADCNIGFLAQDIIDSPKFIINQTRKELNLVSIKVSDLGFKEKTKYSDICDKAKVLGLKTCFAEVGPQLLMQCKDLPKGSKLYIAMEPISGSCGEHFLFRVERFTSKEDWLFADNIKSQIFFEPDTTFVFVN